MARRRASRPRRDTRMALGTRVGLVAGGLVATAAGVSLLVHESATNAARLGRLAGILILVGVIVAILGAIGRV